MRFNGDRIINMQLDSISLPRIEGGVSGEAALEALNAPIEAAETILTELASRISNLNNKSAVIRQHVPISSTTQAGDLVYFDYDSARFMPAQALTLGTPGSNGETIEAPCSRVEGMIVSADASSLTGTLLCGGYYESPVIASCVGNSATRGTYYLSPFTAGKAVLANKLKGHFRQPVLSYHGNGNFTMNLFHLAHDNHFHGSLVLGNNWVPASTMSDVTVPKDALWCYKAPSTDEAMINAGELTKATTAVFYNGILQLPDGDFVVDSGYVWSRLPSIPASNSVTIFNHYPFAYDSPVVRGVESTNASLAVKNKNGLIQLTQNAFISGSTAKNALAIAAISDNILQYTPVVTDIIQGPGVVISTESDGSRTISSSSIIGTLLDATTINHNGTTVTSDGIYQYITYPKGRNCSFTMQINVDTVSDTDTVSATVWGMAAGNSASFNVEMFFVPEPVSGSTIKLDRNAKIHTTLAIASGTGSIGMSDTPDTMTFTGRGTLIAKVSNITVNNAINLFRVGFRLALVSSSNKEQSAIYNPITPTTALVNSLTAGYAANIYDLLYVSDGKLYKCSSSLESSGDRCIGIALSDCSLGDNLDYMIAGIIQDPSFNFIPGSPVYVGTDGRLTQEAREDIMTYIQKVGVALTSTVVQINIDSAIMTKAN